MRRQRLSIGNRGNRRFNDNIVILRPIANNGGWSVSSHSNINDVYNYPNTEPALADATFCTGDNITDSGLTVKWFFGGLRNGGNDIYKIEVMSYVSGGKFSDTVNCNFNLKGVSYPLSVSSSVQWQKTTIYGSWTFSDLSSDIADYTNGCYYDATIGIGNSKDINVYNIQIWLYTR